MLKNSINNIISKMKGTDYTLDSHITSSALVIIMLNKLFDYIRGTIKKFGAKGVKKNIFIGKHTHLIHKKYLWMGKGIQIKDYVEINALSKEGIILGDNASIGKYSIIRGTGSLLSLGKGMKIGKNFGCGDYCFFGCSGGIVIGDDVILGQNVRFHSQNHNFDRIDIPIREQGVVSKGIIVGDNCWIGSGVVILDGVSIGNGCVLGSNALVNKDIPDNSIAVGNPAKIIRKR